MSHAQRIVILGGTGFVGRHLANRLTRDGHSVQIPTRRRERHKDLLINPHIRLSDCNIHDPTALRQELAGCDVVINLVGILNEYWPADGSRYRKAHVELPQKIVNAAVVNRVPRVLHMSALNAYPREEKSLYLKTKGEGEDLMHAAASQGLKVTSFRPSVIFGPDDSFFNRFAGLLRLSPGFFPLACPNAKFSPVYIGDVVEAFVIALADDDTICSHLDLCGPRSYTLQQLVAYTAEQLGLRRRIIPLGQTASWLQARLLELLPNKPFTRDNYYSLQKDSVCKVNALPKLGIHPTAVEAIVPGYLGKLKVRRRYQDFRRLARRSYPFNRP